MRLSSKTRIAVFAFLFVVEACEDDDGDRTVPSDANVAPADAGPTESVPCIWGVDALLEEVGTAAADRTNCGLYLPQVVGLAASAACFEDAVDTGLAVELTLNGCIDCVISTTYVTTVDGDSFAITQERDIFGDEERESVVEGCSSIEVTPTDVSCEAPVELYRCREALDAPFPDLPPQIPVMPLKLADLPVNAGETAVVMHLFVLNESGDPYVGIHITLDDVSIVAGDFWTGPADQDPGKVYTFDVTVPAGSHTLATSSDGPDVEVSIEVPGERWVVLSCFDEDVLPARFTLDVHAQPVGFD